MKIYLTFLLFLFGISLNGQIIISEIMYNPPEAGEDSLEYIELYNISDNVINLQGYTFGQGVELTFPDVSIDAKTYIIIAKSSAAMNNVFQKSSIQWESGSLSNSGETISLNDSQGNVINQVTFDDGGDWPIEADGSGYSLELCDVAADNSLAKNWGKANSPTNITINDIMVIASPGAVNGLVCDVTSQTSDIAITEIMYNANSTSEDLDFIELYNYGSSDINLLGWTISNSINYTFGDISIPAGQYLAISSNGQAFDDFYLMNSLSWTSGVLDNNEGEIILKDNSGSTVDSVHYNTIDPWPLAVGESGRSIILCNPKNDNSDGTRWSASSTSTNKTSNGIEIFASPGKGDYCAIPIGIIRILNTDGLTIENESLVTATGTLYGVNLRPGGTQFTLIDDLNYGIAILSLDNDFGGQLAEGDKVSITGKVEQFNGLAQIAIDGLVLISQNQALEPPTVVTVLDEFTESQLITIQNVSLKDKSQWTGQGSGFNVTVTNGSNDFDVRIDADVDLFGMAPPTGTFDITGLGGQFDNTIPFTSGYQLLPRYVADISPYNPSTTVYPSYTIAQITQNNAMGIPDSLNVRCSISGIVYGVNKRPSGLEFTLIDDNNDGIGIFHAGENFGYVVNEGDELTVRGRVDHFSGLTQLIVEELDVLSSNNALITATEVQLLNEATESQLIQMNNCTIYDASEWLGNGSSFNVRFYINFKEDDIFTMRIDNDSDLSTMPAPTEVFNLRGLGGQFDSSEPHDEGYLILPRYAADIIKLTSTNDLTLLGDIKIFPNPASEYLIIDTKIDYQSGWISDIVGRKILDFGQAAKLDISHMQEGIYIISLRKDDRYYTSKFVIGGR